VSVYVSSGSGAEGRLRRASLRSALSLAVLFLLLWAVVAALQWLSGAYSSEFNAYPDESAHYVTSLMARDYVAAGFPGPPLKYAENYYVHYPKVAFGWWGPLLHTIGGVWMLLFSCSRESILILMSLITALLAVTLYAVLRREFALEVALTAALLLVALPAVQTSTSMVMGDTLLALFQLWAALCFARFLESERRRDALWFGVWATAGVLVKGGGMALTLLPPLALVSSRWLHWLKRLAFWLPAGMVLLLAGPWQYLSFRLQRGSQLVGVHWTTSSKYVWLLTLALGGVIVPLAGLGIYERVIRPWRAKAVQPLWAVSAALTLAPVVFHSLYPLPGAEIRYCLSSIPPLLMFFAAGVVWVAERAPFPGLAPRARTAVLLALAAAVFAWQSFVIPQKPSQGLREVAELVLARPQLRHKVLLVSSESRGEGPLIAEIAMREQRPGSIILRANKVLSQSDWFGERYKLTFTTPEAVMAYLESIPVSAVILDTTPGTHRIPHHELLGRTIATFPQRFRRVVPASDGAQPAAQVYEVLGVEHSRPGKIRIDLPYTLGRSLEK